MPADTHRVVVRIDELLAARGLTLTQLSDQVGVTLANLSVLKNGHARAIRFTTLTALCDVLRCQPGDLLGVNADQSLLGDHQIDADDDTATGSEVPTDQVTSSA